MYLNIIKAIYGKPIPNTIVSGKKLKAFPLRSKTRQDCPLLALLFNISLQVLDLQLGKIKKSYSNQKGRSKIFSICRRPIIHRKP